MSGILFLAHRVPFPPDRGDKIRSHHVLRALAELAPVHVGCFAETDADHSCEVEQLAASYCMPVRGKPLASAGIEALLRGKPVSLTAFHHPDMATWVARTLETAEIDTIYVFSGQMGQYLPDGWPGRVVIDLCDVDSAKFEAYAGEKAAPARWVYAREGRLLRIEEARLAARADHTLLVSEAEGALLAGRLPARSPAAITVLGNGIDAAAFDPAQVAPHPQLSEAGPHIVFTGQMDYPPNVEAAVRVIERLMPLIQLVYPEASFHVVGRCPVPELSHRDGVNGARIWGEVPDVRPFLAGADLVLAPLAIARGVQNKVLEAMAMARPVLVTPEAATGLPGSEGQHFVVGKNDEELAAKALELLAAPERASRIGAAARRLVIEQRSWPAMLAGLPALVGRIPGAARQRNAA